MTETVSIKEQREIFAIVGDDWKHIEYNTVRDYVEMLRTNQCNDGVLYTMRIDGTIFGHSVSEISVFRAVDDHEAFARAMLLLLFNTKDDDSATWDSAYVYKSTDVEDIGFGSFTDNEILAMARENMVEIWPDNR